jgi:hypothetical protein
VEEAAKQDNTFCDHILFDLNLHFTYLNAFYRDLVFVIELHKVGNNLHKYAQDEESNRIDIYSMDSKKGGFYP